MPLPCVPWMPRLRALGDLSFGHPCPMSKRPGVISFTMTREEQLKCIEDTCNAFKKPLLAKASKIPPNRDSMDPTVGDGLREKRLDSNIEIDHKRDRI